MVTCNQAATTYLEEPAMPDMYGKSCSDGKFREAYARLLWSREGQMAATLSVFILSYFVCSVH